MDNPIYTCAYLLTSAVPIISVSLIAPFYTVTVLTQWHTDLRCCVHPHKKRRAAPTHAKVSPHDSCMQS